MMPRTKTADSQHTKQRIADAALEQFQLKGYNGTSVQDLVNAAQAPKGTFYNHFASKEDLAAETVRRYSSQWNLDALADQAAGTPRVRIDRHLADLIAAGRDIAAERGCLVANFAGEVPAHSPMVAAAVSAHLLSWVDTLTTVIDEAKGAGEVTSEEPAGDLAEFIVNAWEGGAVKAKATGSGHSIDVFERMVALLLR
jgi:TetR/AcrR family transcriptional regulator, transcriptional repressor for nem operon